MAQVTCKTQDGIFFLLWGGLQHDIWTKSVHNDHLDLINGTYDGYRLLDMRQFRFDYNKKSLPNIHHVALASYVRIVYPYLADVLKFPYKRSDFDLYKYEEDDMICSFLWPKEDMKWTVSINQETTAEHEGFECLTNIERKYPGDKSSAYHRIFCASHCSCQIINESLPDGETIFISGDSYMIPVIPILACYYHEVVSLDNRFGGIGLSNIPYYEGKIFDKVLFACSESNPPIKYLGWNLA